MADPEKLNRSVIFEGIAPEYVDRVCSKGTRLEVDVGHRLFSRDEIATELMLLMDGAVDLVFPVHILNETREVAMERLQCGDVVAWSSLVPPYRLTLSAECRTPCLLTIWERSTLEEYFAEEPRVGHLFMRNLAGVIGRRLQKLQMMWVHDLQTSAAKHMT